VLSTGYVGWDNVWNCTVLDQPQVIWPVMILFQHAYFGIYKLPLMQQLSPLPFPPLPYCLSLRIMIILNSLMKIWPWAARDLPFTTHFLDENLTMGDEKLAICYSENLTIRREKLTIQYSCLGSWMRTWPWAARNLPFSTLILVLGWELDHEWRGIYHSLCS